MNLRKAGWISLHVVAVLLILSAELRAQSKAAASTDDLLKSIGMTKPALAMAPDFTLRDAGGGTVSLSGYRGNLVLLNFWATWCVPCREEMPSMEQLSRNFGGQGFTILAVNQKESAAQVTKYMKTHGLNLSAPLDVDGRVNTAYRVYGIPVTYLIDGGGNAIGMKSGPRDWSARDVVDVFRKLIGETASSGIVGSSLELEPTTPMPSALRTKGGALLVRSQQDPFSEAVAKLPPNEEVTPIGKASGAGEFWYMVRTKSGAIGWVRGVEVEDVSKQR
jgi:thiol-disulfide isomerase/thioredoxin